MLDSDDQADTPELRTQTQEKAVQLLARREHGRRELSRKLMQKLPALQNLPGLVESVLDHCQQQGWQSDERFVEAAVREQMQRHQGPFKIRHWLRQRCDRDDLIDAYLTYDNEVWVAIAQEALAKKFGEDFADLTGDRKQQQRAQRFLHSRGFEGDQIRRAMNTDF
ncbi:regulatory protein RecX [Hydrogenovibrio halophilus]|uniref:regulatory protein RecX n=1 Tax=Hydrogenovibrio halophilus TaxID=373391 RepID=UPI00038134D4|nr:regulatory protein RecX [Hydrogenovibrio halophilus]